MSEGPNVTRESSPKMAALENQGILEDLEFVVGDEVVAKSGSVNEEGKKEEDGEMKGCPGTRRGRLEDGRRGCGWRRRALG